MDKHLIYTEAPVSIEIENLEVDKNALIVKGFASLDVPDRANEAVDPLEFNIEDFLAAPVLYVNHKPWYDYSGNSVAAGRVLSANPVKLVPIKDDESSWALRDLITKEIVDTYPKKKIPSLKKGTSGLFVKAAVTDESLKERIVKGELGGMSWRGLAEESWKVDQGTGKVYKVWTNVDLWEISLVHIPANNQATFMVAKAADSGELVVDSSVDLKTLVLHQVILPKAIFKDKDSVTTFLTKHKVVAKTITEDANAFSVLSKGADSIRLDSLVKVPLGDATVIMASPQFDLETAIKNRCLCEALPVSKGVSKMADEANVETQGAVVNPPAKTDADEKGTTPPNLVTDEKKGTELVNVLAEAVAKSVTASMTPLIEALTKSNLQITDNLGKLGVVVEKMATLQTTTRPTPTKEPETKQEVSKDSSDLLKSLLEEVNRQKKNLEQVSKMAEAVANHVPQPGAQRQEGATAKAEAPKKGNEIFDSCFAPVVG
jgi:hypothetical protein